MKIFVVMLVHSTAYLGWVALLFLDAYKIIPDKWYVALPAFAVAICWAFFMNGVAQTIREKIYK